MQFLANNPIFLLMLFCCLVPAASFGAGVGLTKLINRRGVPTIYWSKKGATQHEEL